MDGIDKNIEEYKPHEKQKILVVFDYMIANMLNNKKLNNKNPIVTNLFIRGRKRNISLVFITQLHFTVPKIFVLTILLSR